MIYKYPLFLVSVTFLFFLLSGPQIAQANVSLGAFGSWGSLKDSNASIPAVRSSTAGAYLLPSLSIFPLLSVGAYGEYHVVGQLTDPASVSNNNKAFSGYLGGGALVLSGPVFRLSGAYTFAGKGTLKNQTSLGLESTLEKPKGMHLILGVSILPFLNLDFGIAKVKYDVLVNGVSSAQTRDWIDYRLGASLVF
jgi:hypothetical protein